MKTKKVPRERIPFLLSGKRRRGDFVGFPLGVRVQHIVYRAKMPSLTDWSASS